MNECKTGWNLLARKDHKKSERKAQETRDGKEKQSVKQRIRL